MARINIYAHILIGRMNIPHLLPTVPIVQDYAQKPDIFNDNKWNTT